MGVKAWMVAAGLLVIAGPAWSCSYERELPENSDGMSFFNTGPIGDELYYRDLRQCSRSYGLRVPERQGRPQIADADAAVDEWMKILPKAGQQHWDATKVRAMLDAVDVGGGPKEWIGANSGLVAKVRGLAAYLTFTAKLNPVLRGTADRALDDWSRGPSPAATPAVATPDGLIDARKIARLRARDHGNPAWLRAKYAFHSIRADVALEDYQAAVSDYRDLVAPLVYDGYTRYRCLGYEALALARLKRDPEAFRAYTEVFDRCEPMRGLTVDSLDKSWNSDQAAQLAAGIQHPHLRAVALYANQLRDQDDHSAAPLQQCPLLASQEVLAVASLMKTVQGAEVSGMLRDRNALLGLPKSGADYAGQAGACVAAAQVARIRQPGLWLAAGAYFSLLDGDRTRAGKLIAQAQGAAIVDGALAGQLHLLETLRDLPDQTSPFSGDYQARVIQDLNWAATLTGPGDNPGIWHSLWLLLAQKSLLDGDRVRAVVALEAASGLADPTDADGWSRSYPWEPHIQYLLDAVADDADLARLQVLLLNGGDGLMAAAAPHLRFQAADIAVIRSVHFIRTGDYVAAGQRLQGIPDDYFKVGKVRPWYQHGALYAGSRFLHRKTFEFESPMVFLKDYVPSGSIGLPEYVAMMAGLKAALEAPGLSKLSRQRLRFKLAAVLGCRSASGWPEIRKLEQYNDELETFRGDHEVYPLGLAPIQADLKARADRFIATMQLQSKQAADMVLEDAKDPADRELAAMGLAAAHQWVKESPEVVQDTPIARRLFQGFRRTAFYQSYRSSCELLQAMEKAQAGN